LGEREENLNVEVDMAWCSRGGSGGWREETVGEVEREGRVGR
jgi:hypothetical protein